MTRDRRLLITILLFIVSAVALVIQAGIVDGYLHAAVMGDWNGFSNPPRSGPDAYCLDYGVADLPFVAGWIGIGGFSAGLALVAYAWWRPMA